MERVAFLICRLDLQVQFECGVVHFGRLIHPTTRSDTQFMLHHQACGLAFAKFGENRVGVLDLTRTCQLLCQFGLLRRVKFKPLNRQAILFGR